MNTRISEEFGNYFARIPLTSTAHIHNTNALRVDWNDVLPAERCSYVLGNPPFIGKKEQTDAQKEDVIPLFSAVKSGGVLDFVCAWYFKASNYIGGTRIRCAFVSTKSITQGEQVGVLWSWLLAKGIHIHFAHRTFQWSNEANDVAAVHCVIVGFGAFDVGQKTIFEYEDICSQPHAVRTANINPYLVDALDVVLHKRGKPVCNVPPMSYGSMALDDGHLLMSDAEKTAIVAAEPRADRWIRRFVGGEEFLNNGTRWCLWLKDISPAELRALSAVAERVDRVRRYRKSSGRATTVGLADYPSLFGEDRQPDRRFLLVPKVSSEGRPYLPIGFCEPDVIASGSCLIVPGARRLEFGVLLSVMHMAWMRYVCGRLESRYQYSAGIVYNNFPWPENPTVAQKQKIEAAAQAVLDARAAHPNASLADLYDPLTMPPNLVKAHQALDAAVDAAYGRKGFKNDAERVAFLFDLYQRYTSLLPVLAPARKGRKRVGQKAD